MKILIVSDYKTGGAGHVANATGDLFNGMEDDVKYFWGSDYFKFSLSNYLMNRDASSRLQVILKEFNPEIIMLHNFDNLLSPHILTVIKNYKKSQCVKVIMTMHDYHILSPSNSLTYYKNNKKSFFHELPNLKELLLNSLDKRTYFHGVARLLQWGWYYKCLQLRDVIDDFICPSLFIMNKAKKLIKPDKLHLIHNPTEVSQVADINKTKSKDEVLITYVGRLTEEKGVLPFFSALTNYSFELSEKVIFQIIGTGDLYDDLERQITKNKTHNIEIVLLGQLENKDVLRAFFKSHYVLLPSTCYENAPLSLIEGAMCGCKIITMNYGGMKEIADQQQLSFLMDNFDEGTLIELIQDVVKNRNISVTGEKIRSSYSGDNYFNLLSKLFD